MKELAKITNASLELLELREIKCSLEKSVSISIGYYLDSSRRMFWGLEIVEYNIFTNSLMDATIQNGVRGRKTICYYSML